jgi:lipoate---protein ligase
MHQNVVENGFDPEEELAADWASFQAVETGAAVIRCRCWETTHPVVVIGHHGVVADEVIPDACRADGVRVLRRFSGGGAVVLGPGCLNYAVALSLVSWPDLLNVEISFECVLRTIVTALDVTGLSRVGTDLVLRGRKVSGNAQRRGHRTLIHHGTLLYDFDAGLATRYLKEPDRRPTYRGTRRHEDFIGNIPLSRTAIRARVEEAWPALGA